MTTIEQRFFRMVPQMFLQFPWCCESTCAEAALISVFACVCIQVAFQSAGIVVHAVTLGAGVLAAGTGRDLKKEKHIFDQDKK